MNPPYCIAHYRVSAKLGEGGMGAVFRATDTKLNRDVAIKILPDAFAEDPDRMARFTREAQVLASLNHPNIAAIYGVEERALVMELVEGEDLRGPVPVDTALKYARQIASALEAAHEKGIVHRDLKPANIKITPDGTVKLLDFGLAKAGEATASVSGSPTMSPTVSMSMTHPGVILGTAAYMSPEQARGKMVDHRADIWAFGVVLFEMLAGRRLFHGDTLTDTIASVVKTEPDWTALPSGTPLHIRWLLERCLSKDPTARLQSIGDARMLIDHPLPAGRARPRESAARRWLPWIAIPVAVAATVVSLSWLDTKSREPTTRFVFNLPEGLRAPFSNNAPQFVPSPDRRYLAFIAQDEKGFNNYLWIRPMGSLSARRLEMSEGANFPFWSPDGQYIGFFAGQKLKKIGVLGGSAQILCDIAEGLGAGGTWNQEGTIVFAPSQPGPLMRVDAAGGLPAPVTSLDSNRGEVHHTWPQFLPDGKHFIYLATSSDPSKSGIYVQKLSASTSKLILLSAFSAAFAPPGYLLFIRESALYAQRLDLKDHQLQGDPTQLADNVASHTSGSAYFTVSASGVLAYREAASIHRQLTWYSRDGKRLGIVGDPGEYTIIRLSPDETQVALMRRDGGSQDAWVMNIGSGILTRATRDLKLTAYGAVWSPDSRRIVISEEGGGLKQITLASGATTTLFADSTTISANDWSPDGQSLLCVESHQTQVLLLPLFPETPGANRKMQTVRDTRDRKFGLRFSPDGKWIAYTSNESGQFEVYVASFPSFIEKRRVSQAGGVRPVWSRDGKELFFPLADGTLMAAEIKTGSKLEVGIPQPLLKMRIDAFGQFDVSTDGKRFLVNEVIDGPSREGQITLVLNWVQGMN